MKTMYDTQSSTNSADQWQICYLMEKDSENISKLGLNIREIEFF
jgi:hypothetical protein